MFRARLDQITNLKHELVRLAGTIDWAWIDAELAGCFSDEGRPGLTSRFMVGFLFLKHIHGLSNEEVCARWVYAPLLHRRGILRPRLPPRALRDEPLAHTHRRQVGGALGREPAGGACDGRLEDERSSRVTVDTAVQPKNVTRPTDAKLMLTAIEKLGALAQAQELRLRQSYARLAKRAALMAGRYTHTKQFKRANRELRFLRTWLGRLIRDVRRKIEGNERLHEIFADPLDKAHKIRWQNHSQRGRKPYSWHAPETECIGMAKAHKPYEFGVKVSVTTTNRRCKGGQFVLHTKALPGNPYDGHTLGEVIKEMQELTGRQIERAYADKDYRGHDAPKPLRVFISGQKRGVFGAMKRELNRRSAIEPVIGHLKSDGHLGRNYLKGRHGDHTNAVLSAVGRNLRLILKWLRLLLHLILAAIRMP